VVGPSWHELMCDETGVAGCFDCFNDSRVVKFLGGIEFVPARATSGVIVPKV
jgi:hypothetical protein